MAGLAAMLGAIGMMYWMLKEKGPKMTKLEKAALAMLTALAEKCEAYEAKIEALNETAKRDVERALAAEKRVSEQEHTRKLIQSDLEATRAELASAKAAAEYARKMLQEEIERGAAREARTARRR